MKIRKIILASVAVLLLLYSGYYCVTHFNISAQHQVGDVVDSLDGVSVYHNGGVSHTEGRNLTTDGYNLGLKYQCVEFVKRYYYEHYGHKMPEAYGHAKSFFDDRVAHGSLNRDRGLVQYQNNNTERPQKGDLVVLAPTIVNPYGHVAIIAELNDGSVTVIQQNYGLGGEPRETYGLSFEDGKWSIGNSRIKGWLRKE